MQHQDTQRRSWSACVLRNCCGRCYPTAHSYQLGTFSILSGVRLHHISSIGGGWLMVLYGVVASWRPPNFTLPCLRRSVETRGSQGSCRDRTSVCGCPNPSAAANERTTLRYRPVIVFNRTKVLLPTTFRIRTRSVCMSQRIHLLQPTMSCLRLDSRRAMIVRR